MAEYENKKTLITVLKYIGLCFFCLISVVLLLLTLDSVLCVFFEGYSSPINRIGFWTKFFGFLHSLKGALTLMIIVLDVMAVVVIVCLSNLINTWHKTDLISNEIDSNGISRLIASELPKWDAEVEYGNEKANWTNLIEDGASEIAVGAVQPVKDGSDGEQVPTVSDVLDSKVDVTADNTQVDTDVNSVRILTAAQISAYVKQEPKDDGNDYEILPDEDELQEEVSEIDNSTGLAIIVGYNKSFTAKLIQSDDRTKEYYSLLKNELLSYRKVKDRMLWGHENYNSGNINIARFSIRGNMLCIYFALAADDCKSTKYIEFEQGKKNGNLQCMVRLKNACRVKRALDLIEVISKKFGLEKAEIQAENYYVDYEPVQPLIEKGLVKELITEENYIDFMHRFSRREVDRKRREVISVKEADEAITDDVALALIVDKRTVKVKSSSGQDKKGIVYVNILSDNYVQNERITLVSLKNKGFVAQNVSFLKVAARGKVNKPLSIEAQEFTIEAVKMIVLTGGKAIKV